MPARRAGGCERFCTEMSKAIKAWGTLGGLKTTSTSRQYPPAEWVNWPLWVKEENYTETTYTYTDGQAPPEPEPSISPDGKTLTWYQVTKTAGGGPATVVTIKTCTAHRWTEDDA